MIILATTVSRPGPFCSDAQRLNVALTRARRHLIVCADLCALPQLAPAFRLLLQRAAALPGGICEHVAAFAPQPLPASELSDSDLDGQSL